jgi:hypothetical protein
MNMKITKLKYEIEIPECIYEKNGGADFALYFEEQIVRMLRQRLDFSRVKAKHIECSWVTNDKSSDL